MSKSKAEGARKDLSVGVFQFLPLPSISRYLAQIGWDWILLDMQHGPFTFETIYECIHTIRTAGSKPFVRVPVGDYDSIQKVLDFGAQAVVVPMVNTRSDAERAVQAAKYPPVGGRSIGGDPWYHYGADYPKVANHSTLLIVQIEHTAAVKAAKEILSVEGVDGCFVGPSDLALSLGLSHINFEKNSTHRQAVHEVIETARVTGKPVYIHCASVKEAEERASQGIKRLNLSSDVDMFIGTAKGLLAKVRKELGKS